MINDNFNLIRSQTEPPSFCLLKIKIERVRKYVYYLSIWCLFYVCFMFVKVLMGLDIFCFYSCFLLVTSFLQKNIKVVFYLFNIC